MRVREPKRIGCSAAAGSPPATHSDALVSETGVGDARSLGTFAEPTDTQPSGSRCLRTDSLTADLLVSSVITSIIMAAVGVLACAGPARRALRIHPTEALRQG